MIDPASSWFEIVELPVTEISPTGLVQNKHTETKQAYFDKSSIMISNYFSSPQETKSTHKQLS
jgi:hypothetical protein